MLVLEDLNLKQDKVQMHVHATSPLHGQNGYGCHQFTTPPPLGFGGDCVPLLTPEVCTLLFFKQVAVPVG